MCLIVFAIAVVLLVCWVVLGGWLLVFLILLLWGVLRCRFAAFFLVFGGFLDLGFVCLCFGFSVTVVVRWFLVLGWCNLTWLLLCG